MKLQIVYPIVLGFTPSNASTDSIKQNLKRVMRSVNEPDFVHPQRGEFNANAALDWATLKKQGTTVSDLPEIYLCRKRKRGDGEDACCLGKNTECFTNGGCFCDESCQQYDDCCPDYNETCANLLDLCLTTEATPVGAPKAHEAIKRKKNGDGFEQSGGVRHHGVRPIRVEPNSCCGMAPYNDGESCCCDGSIVEIPCSDDPCK